MSAHRPKVLYKVNGKQNAFPTKELAKDLDGVLFVRCPDHEWQIAMGDDKACAKCVELEAERDEDEPISRIQLMDTNLSYALVHNGAIDYFGSLAGVRGAYKYHGGGVIMVNCPVHKWQPVLGDGACPECYIQPERLSATRAFMALIVDIDLGDEGNRLYKQATRELEELMLAILQRTEAHK